MSEQLSRKADIALSNLTSDGGYLNPEQSNTFIRNLIDTPTMLNEIRVYPMSGPTAEINKIGFGSRILRAARQSGGSEDAGGNNRYVRAADRAKPDLGKISLSTKEVIAEVRIPYEVLEDNIEKGNMAETVLQLIAERAALDLEELIIQGDTALSGSDAYLGLVDGVLKLTTAHVTDAAGGNASPELWNEMKKSIPTAYRRNLTAMRYYVHPDIESDYRLKIASRGGDLGDALLTGVAPLPVFGSKMAGAAMMPTSKALFTNPQNVIFGIQRNIRIEQERDIRSREVVIVLTARVDVKVETQDAIAKATNVTEVVFP